MLNTEYQELFGMEIIPKLGVQGNVTLFTYNAVYAPHYSDFFEDPKHDLTHLIHIG